MSTCRRLVSAVVLTLVLLGTHAATVAAVAPGTGPFQRTWERTDKPVRDGVVNRTWMWGPEAFTEVLSERYDDAEGGYRSVQYFDKSRMEINDEKGDQDSPFFVTNGLLVVEMVEGKIQLGDAIFDESPDPANIPVAGDPDDTLGPTYATMGIVRVEPPASDGTVIINTLSRDGTITPDTDNSRYNIVAAHRVQEVGIDHQIASPFWDFMNASDTVYENGEFVTDTLFENSFYATGYPITEAYWADVKVDGTYREVLMQCFERRCLTYTPGNPAGFVVEAGNVGQHYNRWRYDQATDPCVTAEDDLVVTTDTVFCTGTVTQPDVGRQGVIIVGADNITLDGGGMTLDGGNDRGIGISLNGHSGVIIRNFVITNYYHAIRAEYAMSLLIEDNLLSGNNATDDSFLNMIEPLEMALGGGVLFNDVQRSTVQRNVGNGQDVGINLYASNDNVVVDNDVALNSAWGIKLAASSRNRVSGNRADHVNRWNNTGCYSAGILLTQGSNANVIRDNVLTNSGNNFFIGNQFAQPSNDNLIERNDGSFSVNNCFEITFSERNVIRDNVANGCNYRLWLGFSHDGTMIENNLIQFNRRHGIAWEHGHQGVIVGNEISGNGRAGIWFHHNPENFDFPHQRTSEAHLLTDNTITANGESGLHFSNTITSDVRRNLIDGNSRNLYFTGASSGNVVTDNDLLNGIVQTDTPPGLVQDVTLNWWGTTEASQIAAMVVDGSDVSNRGLITFDPWLTGPFVR